MDTIIGRPHRVSLGDVAAAVGTSKATVCRALLGRRRVAAATRERVLEVAQRLGYRPDPALSALSRHRWAGTESRRATYQVALIRARGPNSAPLAQAQRRLNASLLGVRERCHEIGILLSEWILDQHESPAHLGRMLYNRGVDGLVINVEGPVTAWDFPWDKFALVTIGHDHPTHAAHSVVPDWHGALQFTIEQTLAAGYTRIGFAAFHRQNPAIDTLLDGLIRHWQARLEADYGPQPAVFRYPGGSALISKTVTADGARFGHWLEKEAPDAVIDTNHFAYWWLRDHGYEPPKRIGYATCLGPPYLDEGKLSAADLRRDVQGRNAVDLAYNLMHLNQRGMPDIPMRLVVAARWGGGATLRSTSAGTNESAA